MKIKKILKSKIFKIFIFLLVFAFTFILRAHSYERTPSPNHLDEQLYALSGINLIEAGVPISWSTLDYPEEAIVYEGVISYQGGEPSASVKLYKPWLDEPPLFSLLVGGIAHLFNADRNGFIPASFIRFPMIFVSAATSIFIFLIARLVSGCWTGILAMLIYGTEPIMVFASRTALPENLIALLFVIAIFLLLKFQKSPRFVYIFPIPLLAGIAGLSKPTGYFILGISIYLVAAKLIEEKSLNWTKIIKYILYLILATVPFLIFYIWYGNYFSPEIFKRIISIQGFRPVGFGNLAWFFTTPSFSTSIFKSSWYVFYLLSAAFFIFQPKDKLQKLISLSFVYWLAIVMLSSGETDLLAWYRFPALPFLAIMGAWGIQYLVIKPNFFTSFLAVGFFLGSRTLLTNAFRQNISPETLRLTITSALAPSLIYSVFPKKWLMKLSKIVIIGVMVVGMWWNIRYIYNAYEIECQSKTCPMVPSTFLSEIHYPIIWRFLVLGEK